MLVHVQIIDVDVVGTFDNTLLVFRPGTVLATGVALRRVVRNCVFVRGGHVADVRRKKVGVEEVLGERKALL